jgi:glycerol-3-phosphate O-acyltransferase/dihydroxyacetone phosphate acyltransferase
MNWLDDKTIFNWSRTDDSEVADDVFFYLDKSGISGRSRSGSASESDTRSHSRNRSRNNSFSSSSTISSVTDGFKLEGLTPTNNTLIVPDDNNKKRKATARRIFRIDDVDEDDQEVKLGNLAVSEHIIVTDETKKDI